MRRIKRWGNNGSINGALLCGIDQAIDVVYPARPSCFALSAIRAIILNFNAMKNRMRLAQAILMLLVALHAAVTQAQQSPKKCRYVKTAQLPVNLAGQRALVEGSINTISTPFLIDTGADKTHVSYDFAEKNQFKLAYMNRSSIGVGGVSQIYTTRVDEFSVGAIKGNKITLLVDGTPKQSGHYGGLIGADFLFQSDLELAMGESLIRFFHPVDCENAFLGYWGGDITTLDIDTHDQYDARPVFTVLVNGHKVKAILDTGATTSLIDKETAKKVGMVLEPKYQDMFKEATGVGKRKMKIWLEKFDSMQIGDELIPSAAIAVGDMWGNAMQDRPSAELDSANKESAQLILGLDYIKEHRILFAMGQRKLYISYLGGPLFLSVTP